MKKTIYNKLVRDNIPKIIKDNGEQCEILELSQSDYLIELKNKLQEEVSEYLSSENEDDSIEELADILEVIHALAKAHNKSFIDVEAVREKKFIDRGGFERKLYLLHTITSFK